MNEKTVSCVILNYNDAETTLNLVLRVKGYSLIDHIVVVDNCSVWVFWSFLPSTMVTE